MIDSSGSRDYGSTSSSLQQLDAKASNGSSSGTDKYSSNAFKRALFQYCVVCRSPCCMKRYLIAAMCSIGFMLAFSFRCSAAIATSHFRALYNETSRLGPGNRTGSSSPYSQWTAGIIGTIEGAYFVGILITQVPAGLLSSKVPATRVFSMVILSSSVLNLLLPIAFSTSSIFALAIRLMQGLFEGFCYPSCHGIWRYWAPPLDRSRLVSLSFGGGFAGVFLGLMLSGVLADHLGWQAPFYFYGGAGVLWFCAWQLCVFPKPSLHPCISDEEREYIETSIGENMDVQEAICDLPWGKFFTSMPVYSIIVANFCRNWIVYLLITQPTKYFSDVFNYSFSVSGFVSSLPHLILAIVVPLSGQLADELRKRWLSTTVVRKLFNSVGFGVEAALLLGVAYTTNVIVAICCLTIGASFGGLAITGFNVNHLDIAPRYASILMGLSNGIGGLAGLLMPIMAAYLTVDHTQQSWSRVFLITALLNFAGVAFYAIFGSGNRQDWAEAATDKELPPTEASESRRQSLSGGELSLVDKGGVESGSAGNADDDGADGNEKTPLDET